VVVGVAVALLKAQALSGLLHHRVWVIVILGLGLLSSVVRTRPVGVALTAGPLLAFALAPASTALGIAVGVGAFGLLLAMFFAVGTVLMARQDRRTGGLWRRRNSTAAIGGERQEASWASIVPMMPTTPSSPRSGAQGRRARFGPNPARSAQSRYPELGWLSPQQDDHDHPGAALGARLDRGPVSGCGQHRGSDADPHRGS